MTRPLIGCFTLNELSFFLAHHAREINYNELNTYRSRIRLFIIFVPNMWSIEFDWKEKWWNRKISYFDEYLPIYFAFFIFLHPSPQQCKCSVMMFRNFSSKQWKIRGRGRFKLSTIYSTTQTRPKILECFRQRQGTRRVSAEVIALSATKAANIHLFTRQTNVIVLSKRQLHTSDLLLSRKTNLENLN